MCMCFIFDFMENFPVELSCNENNKELERKREREKKTDTALHYNHCNKFVEAEASLA